MNKNNFDIFISPKCKVFEFRFGSLLIDIFKTYRWRIVINIGLRRFAI